MAAAMELAAERGLDGISMRELAARMGTTPMAAYHHIESREHLVQLVVDRIGGTLSFEPTSAPWDQRLTRWAHQIRDALRRYPGTAGWLLTNPPAGPNALVILETALAALVDAGLDDEQAAVGYGVLSSWVLTRCEIEDRDRMGSDDERSGERRSWQHALEHESGETFPLATRFAPTFASLSSDDLFDAGLRVIIDGIRAGS